MTEIQNIYFNIGEDCPPEFIKQKVLEAYEKYPKIRMIFDLDGQKISISAMKKTKKVFEEIGVEKLHETCIVAREGFKATLIKQFLKLVKTQRPVKILT